MSITIRLTDVEGSGDRYHFMLRCWGKGFVDLALGVMGFGSVLTLFKRLKEKGGWY